MAKCKVCGKQIERGRIVCDECTEELRMKTPTSDKIEPWEMAQASVMKGLMSDPFGDATPTQRKIREITEAMKDLLLYKNNKYGDSAISPKKIFYKGDSTNFYPYPS